MTLQINKDDEAGITVCNLSNHERHDRIGRPDKYGFFYRFVMHSKL